MLRKGETEWTLDIDVGGIAAGERQVPVHEVELELRAGDPAQLFDFALQLHERLDLRPAARSKAERGYALARGEGAGSQSTRRVHLEADAALEDVFGAALSQCLAHFTANADCASEGVDPEGVHQMRIGVRRARTHSIKCCSSSLSGSSFAMGTGSRTIRLPANSLTMVASFSFSVALLIWFQ